MLRSSVFFPQNTLTLVIDPYLSSAHEEATVTLLFWTNPHFWTSTYSKLRASWTLWIPQYSKMF